MERSTIRWIIIPVVAFACLVMGIRFANRPLAVFKTPSGGEVVVQRLTLGPNNRFPIVTGGARVRAFFERIFFGSSVSGRIDADLGSEQAVLWTTVAGGSAPMMRVVHGGVERGWIQPIAFPFVGETGVVHAYPLTPLPRGARSIVLEWADRPISGSVVGRQQLGPLVHTMDLSLSAATAVVEGHSPDTTPRQTNSALWVEFVGVEIATNRADLTRRDSCLLSLRVWENGAVSTNWSASRLQMATFESSGRWSHLANRDHVDGVMRVGIDPGWLDDSVWSLNVGLVRKSGFPSTNLIEVPGLSLADLMAPPGKGIAPSIPFAIEGRRIVTLDVELDRSRAPSWLEGEAPFLVVSTSGKISGTNALPIVEPGVWRLAGIVDSSGNRISSGRWAWGAMIHFSLKRDQAFSNAVSGPLTVILSHEPVVDFTFKVRPSAATNESAWPREEPRKTH